jgi:hypothetical protein
VVPITHLRLAERAATPDRPAPPRGLALDLTVRQGYYMKLIETSRRESSLAMHTIRSAPDMIVSAVGRAYAFCLEVERERILAHSQHPGCY